jgi:superfamily II DNA or RNA helicase
MKITLSNQARIEASESIIYQIEKHCTYPNPKHAEAIKQNYSTRNIPRFINLSCRQDDSSLMVPVGLLPELFTAGAVIDDQRRTVAAQISFTGKLRDYQQRFVSQAMQAGGGVMVAATGSGKTVSGIALAAQLQQRCIILVKSKDLAEQWRAAIEQFTGLIAGLIGGGKDKEGEQFTIATVQTLVKRDISQLNYGMVLADECHNAPASQFYHVINGLNCRYKFGLSATPQRRDGLEMMIHAALGPIVAEIKPSEVEGAVLPVKVEMIEFDYPYPAPDSWNEFIESLVDDEERNEAIIRLITSSQASRPGSVIVLSQQVKHCEILHQMALDAGMDCLLIHGQLPAAERTKRIKQAQTARLIFGTSQLLSEGIDIPPLETLIFASPMSAVIEKVGQPAATKLIQSIGRCRRPYPGKRCAYVIDLVDKCAFGYATANKRSTIYRSQNFKLVHPGRYSA